MPRVKGKAHSPRNKTLIRGLGRLSRSASYSTSGAYAVKNRSKVAAKTQQKQAVTKKFGKKNETRVIRASGPNAYPTEDSPSPLPWVAKSRKPVPLRSSITPGTILILLAGRHRGKRVVFLKQLSSGLLLVTGPFKINGVPLKRVNQAFVIATSKKLDVSGVKVDEKINDSYFKKATERKKKTEAEFFAKEAQQHKPAANKVEDQKAVDQALVAVIKKDRLLGQYLSSRFGLSSKDRPHEMKF